MPYTSIETSKESLRRPCGAHSPQAPSEGTKTSSTVNCITCRRDRTPAEILREGRMEIPRRLAASHLDSKEKQDMARALLQSVENWTVRSKPEFFAQTRHMPLTESDCYPRGYFERSAKKRISIARFLQRVRKMGRSCSEEERREHDMALLKTIPIDIQHPNRQYPYTPLGKPLLPAGTQWRSRSHNTPVRNCKGSGCVYTTFMFAENTAVHLRRLAAQNALNLRVGGSIHAEIVVKDDILEDTPFYRRHADTKLSVARPGRWVQRLVWDGEEFHHKWQSESVCATGSSSLLRVPLRVRPRVQRPQLKKRRVTSWSSPAVTEVWEERQVRSAITMEWEWLRSRYMGVAGSDRVVLKWLINDQKQQWQEADRNASKLGAQSCARIYEILSKLHAAKGRLDEQHSLARTVLGPSNALSAHGISPPQ